MRNSQVLLLKLTVATIQAGILINTLVPPVGCQTISNRHSLSLSTFRKQNSDAPNAGCFVQLESKRVLFFSPNDFGKMRLLYNGSIPSFELKAVQYEILTGKHRQLSKTLSTHDGRLYFDGVAFTSDSMNRLRLSPNWERVLKHSWNIGCSIVELDNNSFLVSGGNEDFGTNHKGEPRERAIIFDASRDDICGEFRMKAVHTRHQSIHLGDGIVLILGGGSDNPSAEIIDTKSKTSLVVAHPALFPDNSAAVLLDKKNVLLVGGIRPSCRWPISDISLLNIEKLTIKKIGSINNRRYFDTEIRNRVEPGVGRIENVLAPVGSGGYVFSGGAYLEPHPLADFCDGILHDAGSFVVRQ